MDVAVGIDPGSRYVGIAVAQVDREGPARLIFATVLDLRGTGERKHLRDALAGRAAKRRLRRSLKASRARAAAIRAVLRRYGVEEGVIREVVAATRRRGWKADTGRTRAEKVLERYRPKAGASVGEIPARIWVALADARAAAPEAYAQTVERMVAAGMNLEEIEARVRAVEGESSGRPHRKTVAEALRAHFSEKLPAEAVRDVLEIVDRSAKSHGLDNLRVGRCH